MEENKNFSFLNRAEITGIVGRTELKDISGKKHIQIAIVTNFAYISKDGTNVVESTWHSAQAFESSRIKDLDTIRKGSIVHLKGRLRLVRYTSQDGIEKSITEIIASELEILGHIETNHLQNEIHDTHENLQ